MALRNVAQIALPATTLTDVVSGAGNASINLKSLVVCNRGATSATFRLLVSLSGAVEDVKQYHFYDMPIVPNDTQLYALDIGLMPGDMVKAYASNSNLSLNLYGT